MLYALNQLKIDIFVQMRVEIDVFSRKRVGTDAFYLKLGRNWRFCFNQGVIDGFFAFFRGFCS